MAAAAKNRLFFGDNLTFLNNPAYFPDESVDLVYLDPPFNSQRGYNVLFKEVDGTPSASQIQAFDDNWQWDADAANRYEEIQAVASGQVVAVMGALQIMLGHTPMFAYLVQMCARLVQLHRVLRKTGSLYLHCDSTASHYLKIVLDSIFGPKNYQNEIIWQRANAHNDAKTRFGKLTDTILFYSKASNPNFNVQYIEHDPEYIAKFYRHFDESGRRYRLGDMASPNPRPNMMYEWQGYAYPAKGWRYETATMQRLHDEGRIHYPEDKTQRPSLKRYLDEMKGTPVGNIWSDIQRLEAVASESLGYPTQKPTDLLKRIILASSNPGDVILDPFCGCGTTIDAVEILNRENPDQKKRIWIGIDITYLAVTLIKNRLAVYTDPPARFQIIGEPEDAKSAEFLAHKDRYEFQFWALGLIGARPWTDQKKKGADKGIDGVRFFNDEGPRGKLKAILVQVKSGKVSSRDIRDFRGTLEREKAPMGVFLTLEPATKDMEKEAFEAGRYTSTWNQQQYPVIQILTMEQLLSDPDRPNPHCLKMPPSYVGDTFKQPVRATQGRGQQMEML